MALRTSILWVLAFVGLSGCATGADPGPPALTGWVSSAGAVSSSSGGPEDTDGPAQRRHDELSPTWSLRLGGITRPRMDASAGSVVVYDPNAGMVKSYGEQGSQTWTISVAPSEGAAEVAGDAWGGATVVLTGNEGRIWIHRVGPSGDLAWVGSVAHGATPTNNLAVVTLSNGGVALAFDDGHDGASQLVFTDAQGNAVVQRESALVEPVRGLESAEGFVVAYSFAPIAASYSNLGDVTWKAELGMQVRTSWSTGDRVVTAGWVSGATCSFFHLENTPDYAGEELPDYDPVAATADGQILARDGDQLRGHVGWGHTWSFLHPFRQPVLVEGSLDSNSAYVLMQSENGDLTLDFLQLPA